MSNEVFGAFWRRIGGRLAKKRDIGLNSILYFCTNKHDVYWSVAKSD